MEIKKQQNIYDELVLSAGQSPYNIPQNWIWTKLAVFSKRLQYGYTESSTNEKIGPKFLRITDIQDNRVDWENVPYCKITDKDFDKYKLNINDIVIARTGATTGKSFLIGVDKEVVFASYLIRISLIDGLLPQFIWYYMQGDNYWNQIVEVKKGIAQPGVNAQKLGELKIPVPPLQEQQRIVSRIETLFSKIDKAKELIEEAREGFENRKAAILAKAFRGELTVGWRLKNATGCSVQMSFHNLKRERVQDYTIKCEEAKRKNQKKPRKPTNLDDKILNENLDRFWSIPSTWAYIPLGKLSDDSLDSIVDGPFGTSINTKEDYIEEGVAVIRINNVQPYDFINDNLKYISEQKFNELYRHRVVGGDVLLSKVGTVGNCCIYPDGYPAAMLSTTGSCKITPDNRIIENKYLCYILNHLKSYMNSIVSQAVQPFLNMKTIKNIPIPVAPLEEQRIIVRILDELFENEAKIQEVTEIGRQIEQLKLSILSKAFRGELGTNDPAEESALKLLEKVIREEQSIK